MFGMTLDTNPTTDERYLAQRRMRGVSDAIFGLPDLLNTGINAGIRDVDYWTGGGLSGGSYDPYQLPMASQSAANLASGLATRPIVPPEAVSPEVQQKGANQQALTGMIPTGIEDAVSLLGPAAKSMAIFLGPGAKQADFPGVTLTNKPNPLLEVYHGTTSPIIFDRPKADLADSGLSVTTDPAVANPFAGAGSVSFPEISGRVYPMLADPGNMFKGTDYEVYDTGDWSGGPELAEDLRGNFTRFGKTVPPEMEGILAHLEGGATMPEALKANGYDSMEFYHGNAYDEESTAHLFTDPGQVVPRYSPEGMLAAQHNPVIPSNKSPAVVDDWSINDFNNPANFQKAVERADFVKSGEEYPEDFRNWLLEIARESQGKPPKGKK